MSKQIASKEAVFAAADGLKARGIRPTYDKLIEALGGGSNSTVRPYFDAWSQLENPPSRAVPDAVDTRARIFIEAVWVTALKETQSEIDIARDASSRQIEQAENALSSSIEINLGLEAERDGLLKQVDELKDLCIDLRYQLRQTDGLRINCEAAEKLAEDRRAVCEVLTREVFALTCVNESLKAHIQQFLEQASTRPARRPNKPSNPASQSHKR